MTDVPLRAIVYDDGAVVGPIAAGILAGWLEAGLKVCGLIEEQIPRPDRRRCDMMVTETFSGERIVISQDRGALARGCMLDSDALVRAGQLVGDALAGGAERAMFNKFGKTESEGAGLRDVIADAIAREIPTVVFVPRRNLDAWRAFAGDLANEIEAQALLTAA